MITQTMEENNKKHLEDLERLKNFCLFDDDFMTKCFESDTSCVEFVLRILLEKQDLQVIESHTQVFMANLLNRSVKLDVLATDSQGIKYNIEIQRSDKGAGQKRARYNSSMLDARLLQKGDDFDDLPETYVIFITENDVIGEGLPLYPVERYISVTGERFDDGAHIIYVNGAYRDDSLVGKLMHDFSCADPEDMNYQVLADRARYFKNEEEGVGIMSKILEDFRIEAMEEGRIEGKKEGAVNAARLMLEDGTLSLEKIAAFAGLSYDEVKSIAENK